MIHILNGDCLLEQFPADIQGDRIICRECLVDGPEFSLDLDRLFKLRASYLDTSYKAANDHAYNDYALPEFNKMRAILPENNVCFWFEDDVFCQINFWFCLYLLSKNNHKGPLYLVRPPSHTPYGFGGLSKLELIQAFKSKTKIEHPKILADLWTAYAQNQPETLQSLSNALPINYNFAKRAVHAYLESLPSQDSKGRPIEALISIKKELDTNKFGLVFSEFCKREAIYGYGDLLVKKLWDTID